jgi:hypothetical protein
MEDFFINHAQSFYDILNSVISARYLTELPTQLSDNARCAKASSYLIYMHSRTCASIFRASILSMNIQYKITHFFGLKKMFIQNRSSTAENRRITKENTNCRLHIMLPHVGDSPVPFFRTQGRPDQVNWLRLPVLKMHLVIIILPIICPCAPPYFT